jgi:D-sedoheptulose 7-phosphate isomerase
MYNKKQYEAVLKSLLSGNMILCGGNGGSICDSMHFVAELTGRYNGNIKPYPAIALGSNQAEVTAFGNDFGYENIFIPYIKAFSIFNPSFLFISTSGTSKNILNAIQLIKFSSNYSQKEISLLTGDIDTSSDIYNNINILKVQSKNVQIIQENHIKILHMLAGDIKKYV